MKQILIGLSMILVAWNAKSQEAIGSAGQNDKTSNAQVSWNIGETVIDHGNTITGSVTQGFEQPDFTVTSIELITNNTNIKAKVFPNPLVNTLNVELDGLEGALILIKVYDSQGRLVFETTSNKSLTQLDFSSFSGAQYHLTIQTENRNFFEKFSLIKSH